MLYAAGRATIFRCKKKAMLQVICGKWAQEKFSTKSILGLAKCSCVVCGKQTARLRKRKLPKATNHNGERTRLWQPKMALAKFLPLHIICLCGKISIFLAVAHLPSTLATLQQIYNAHTHFKAFGKLLAAKLITRAPNTCNMTAIILTHTCMSWG